MSALVDVRAPGRAAPGRARVLGTPRGRVSLLVPVRSCVVGAALVALIVAVGCVALTTGDYHIPLPDVVRALLGGGDGSTRFIVITLRLPRLLTGVLVGAALGVGGAMFQSLSRNPLGSPDIIGFDTGAATGALLVILVLHGTMAQVAAGAVVGGVATALLVYLLAMKRGVQGYRLILVGIGIAAMLSSVNDFLLTRASINDAQSAAVWLTGSLNGRGWEHVRPVALAVAVLLPLASWLGRDLRMLELGDDTARALGVHAERARAASVVVGVGLSAAATACAGPIVFVALAAPQVTRRLTRLPGPNIIPSALTGALLLTASDLAAQRAFAPTQLPVGVATGVVGGLYLAWLLSREWRQGRG
ncbi:FecCD family ABC transporter permease [Pseudofrankia inefficax]|uniref:Transport system permease protein n=1 Tax=Pseudofrankia inefficax (strain DSM 45817 / CECT 9037 / DDB 130130 / EuI1c) TaxID=298654 RepID=E3IVM8_PSEI1|nr:iron chelate uptake ABC transporter family permease subunit [Pseudofrankia inefficax]ADP82534.1 transport system permease protein [Pseudofrankia inefficax]